MRDDDPLIYPAALVANQRKLARRYLESVTPGRRQSVLDELEGRLRAVAQGAKPLYDALRYLNHLCRLVNRGSFEPNLGLAVQNERLSRPQTPLPAPPVPRVAPASEHTRRREVAAAAIAEMRAMLRRS